MLNPDEKNRLLTQAEIIYNHYIVLDVVRHKKIFKYAIEENEFFTLHEICKNFIENQTNKQTIYFKNQAFDLNKEVTDNNAQIKISRPIYTPNVQTKQIDKYNDEELFNLLINKILNFQLIPNENHPFGILLPNNRLLSKLAADSEVQGDSEQRTAVYGSVHEDSSTESTQQFASAVEFRKKSNVILGGAGKIELYRTHLVTLYNIIQRIKNNNEKDNKAMLVALPTGSGKTFLQVLWLHILHLSELTAIFTMPDNLIRQFKEDMKRLLPDDVVEEIYISTKCYPQDLEAKINENKIIVMSTENLLEKCFSTINKQYNKAIFLSFDEQHETDKVEIQVVRREILAKKHISLYLTATPSQNTYIACGRQPVAMMSPEQKQQAGQGKLGSIKFINTQFEIDLKRKNISLNNFIDHVKFEMANFILNLLDGELVSSASRTAISYLPYQISHMPDNNLLREIQVPMARKMLWLIDDNDSLVNFFCGVDNPNYNNFYRCGSLVMNRIIDKNKKEEEKYREKLLNVQIKDMNENDKEKCKNIANAGLMAQVKSNMFHYLIEFILMDVTSLDQIALDKLRKENLKSLQEIVKNSKDNLSKKDLNYFYFKLLEIKVSREAANKISLLLSYIKDNLLLKNIKDENILQSFCDNNFLDKDLYDILAKDRFFYPKFNEYYMKYKVVSVMANMDEAETPIIDSKPFMSMDVKHKKPLKKIKRSSKDNLDMLMNQLTDSYFTPSYFEDFTEENADALFQYGFIGMYVSNKKSIGANFMDLQTVICITENALSANANPALQVQSFGRLRGLNEAQQPVFINVLGRKVKPEFDLSMLAQKGDYYPKYFKAMKYYNKKINYQLGKDLGQKIIQSYYEHTNKQYVTDYKNFKEATLKLIAKTLDQLNTNNHFDLSLSKTQLSEAIINTVAEIDAEIYNLKHSFAINLSTKCLLGFVSSIFYIMNLRNNLNIKRNLAKKEISMNNANTLKQEDIIYLKIIRSNVSLAELEAATILIKEFTSWATQLGNKLTNFNPSTLSDTSQLFDTFSPIIFHPQLLKCFQMLVSDLNEEDITFLFKLNDKYAKLFFDFVSILRTKNKNNILSILGSDNIRYINCEIIFDISNKILEYKKIAHSFFSRYNYYSYLNLNLSEDFKSDDCRIPYREAEMLFYKTNQMANISKHLSDIRYLSNINITEHLEKIKTDVLKPMWWEIKISIWRQNISRLVKNIFFALKEILLYLWQGLKNIKNSLITFISKKSLTSTENKTVSRNNKSNSYGSLNIFTNTVNNTKPISSKAAEKGLDEENSADRVWYNYQKIRIS